MAARDAGDAAAQVQMDAQVQMQDRSQPQLVIRIEHAFLCAQAGRDIASGRYMNVGRNVMMLERTNVYAAAGSFLWCEWPAASGSMWRLEVGKDFDWVWQFDKDKDLEQGTGTSAASAVVTEGGGFNGN